MFILSMQVRSPLYLQVAYVPTGTCTSKFNIIFLSHKISGQIFKFNMFYVTTLWVLCKKIGEFEWDYMRNYLPFTFRHYFLKFAKRYQVCFIIHTVRRVQYQRLALIWNSMHMHVINISPTARFQETNQWDIRPSYIGGTYIHQWDQIG